MTPEEKEICARWWADRLLIPEKREAFKNALLKRIDDNMILSVDYDPNRPLLEALHEAGIECRGSFFSARDILPYKTSMQIYNIYNYEGNIIVIDGYGAPDEVLI